jgi:hypothetical protein
VVVPAETVVQLEPEQAAMAAWLRVPLDRQVR